MRTPAFLFAYGTLQPGMAPRGVRRLTKLMEAVGKASARGTLYDLGEYPGAIFREMESGVVRGTVMRLPRDARQREKLLGQLDEYEGVYADVPSRSLFVRLQISVVLRSGRKINCWAYEYAGDAPAGCAIFDGYYVGPRKNRRTSAKRRGIK